ncbi:YEATS-associated helix-containing protein [Thermodesulfobacteriota bacterium]
MDPQLSVTGIIIVMGGAGAFGGVVNYMFLAKEQLEGWRSFFASLIGGLAASFIMPLFLKTISSNLVANLLDTKGITDASGKLQPKGNAEDVLVFAGFCLIAAISSKAFIQTLSDKVLREAREAKKRTKDLEEEVDVMQETVSPLVESEDTQFTQIESEEKPGFPHVTTDEGKVLKALANSRYTLRSPSGLAKDLRKEREDVLNLLEELKAKGHVRESNRKNRGIRWSISTSGRMVVQVLNLKD